MKNINKEFEDINIGKQLCFGLNVATYKPAVAKCILEAAAQKNLHLNGMIYHFLF